APSSPESAHYESPGGRSLFNCKRGFSRNAAIVNSQGREPLEAKWQLETTAPTGRKRLSPRWGFHLVCVPVQGLTPLAIDSRPGGPACGCIPFAALGSVPAQPAPAL